MKIGYILSFSLGVCAGFGISYRFLKDKIRVEESARADAEIEAFKNYIQAPEEVSVVECKDESSLYPSVMPEITIPEIPESVRENIKNRPISDYAELVNKYREVAESTKNENITVQYIDSVDFGNEYDSVSWTYYPKNDIVTDEYDEVVEDPESTLGDSFKENIGKYDKDIVYVHNNKTELDYEVAVDNSDYYGMIRGGAHFINEDGEE